MKTLSKLTIRKAVVLLAAFLRIIHASAQCGPVISSFPYTEGFESSAAWTSGGTNSDWAWGSPSHPTINAAGGGAKCWCVGGLSGSAYVNSEQAWIMSPCFDFSSLNYPWISFKIFWECERQWDGMVLQYSLNGGLTWANVGAYGDPVDCLNQNWYNYNNITWLNSLPAGTRHGWSGRIGPTVSSCTGGFGSGGWVTAKHCMSNLANQPNVRFRFLFGSGTTCNAYDGIAIDDILIDNAPANVANFSWACTGGNSVSFSNLSTPCPTAFSWNFGDPSSAGNTSIAANPSHTFSGPGTYTVTLMSSGPCNAAGTISIPVTILGNSISFTNVSCNGAANGSATVTATGGSGPFTYSWSPTGGTSATAAPLSPGAYSVTVSAAGACPSTGTVQITQPPQLTETISSSNVNCNGGTTGSANAIGTGGTGPYSYSWSPAGGTSSSAGNLAAGNYTCVITDAHGCTVSQSVAVTEPTALSASASTTPAICGNTNGSATVSCSGGTGTCTYAWLPSGGNSSSATSLPAGTYTCTITDANGCTTSVTAVVGNSGSISASAAAITNVSCFGGTNGSATASPAGGTGPYTYSWSPSGGNSSTATGLGAGTYTCQVTDANGCIAATSVTISQPNALSSSSLVTNALCNGDSSGSATLFVSGGTPSYAYAWMPYGGTTATAASLVAGTYTCTITDALNCISTQTVAITQPSALSLSGTVVNVACAGNATGTATVVAGGGSQGYSYSWAPAGGNAATASGLFAQQYTCTVTDANGCSASVSLDITEPPPLSLVAAGFNVTCANNCDGQAVVIPSGGNANYSFLWSTGCTSASCTNVCAGTYSVLVTDGNGCTASDSAVVTAPAPIVITVAGTDAHCNLADGTAAATASGGSGNLNYTWINGPSAQNINSIAAGTYSVVVTDQNSCSDTAAVLIGNIPGLSVSSTSFTNLTCAGSNDGSITVTVSNNPGSCTYLWQPNVSSSNTATGLPAGVYSVIVTDSSGCADSATVNLTQPAPLSVTVSASDSSICAGQSVQLNAATAGGTPNYTISWSPVLLTGNSLTVQPPVSQLYSAVVADANGCTDSTQLFILVENPPLLTVNADSLSGCVPLCVNFSGTTSAAVNAWSWDFGDGNTSTQQNPQHCYPVAGVYSVQLTATSAAGCAAVISLSNSVNVFATPVAAFTANPQPATMVNPEISFTDASAGASSWLWTFGDLQHSSSAAQNPVFSYPDAGCYPVLLTVTSSNGCTDTASQEICIDPEITLYVPNAFTPNGDGHNDYFLPSGTGLDWNTMQLKIFDRWGNLVFESQSANQPWDGKVQGQQEIVEEDVYVWQLYIKDINGGNHNRIGHVSVIK